MPLFVVHYDLKAGNSEDYVKLQERIDQFNNEKLTKSVYLLRAHEETTESLMINLSQGVEINKDTLFIIETSGQMNFINPYLKDNEEEDSKVQSIDNL